MAKKILLVEDSPTQASILQMVFANKGYTVDIARDGEDGMALANQFQPNLIILDMYLPNMTGLEVCKQLKNNIQMRGTAVVMFSMEKRLQNINSAYEAGADCYVPKSEEGHEVLLSVVDTIFARQEAAGRRTPLNSKSSNYF